MEIGNNNILDLIARSFTGKLSEEETNYLKLWKEESKENNDEYSDYKDLWERSKILSHKLSVNTQEALAETRRKAGINSFYIRWKQIALQAAAVLIISIVFSILYTNISRKEAATDVEKTVYQHVKAACGTQTKIELEDGTIVFINSGSELSFPNSFSDKDVRLVKLSGEGYFTVAKNKEKPFIVEINKLQVKVLGTSFNVEAYPNNSNTTIALVEGQIELQQNGENRSPNITTMKPNQIAVFNNSSESLNLKTETDLSKYIDWKEGKIVFSNDPISIVMEKLENWYNVDIDLADNKLQKYRFTGTFINEPVENILYILSITSNMKYKIFPSKAKDNKSYSKCRIVLKSK
jgi:transmembrane sensor